MRSVSDLPPVPVIDDDAAAAEAIQHVSVYEAQLFLAHVAQRRPKLFLDVMRNVREQSSRTAALVADPPAPRPVRNHEVFNVAIQPQDEAEFLRKWITTGAVSVGKFGRSES
ncbi:MAG: hypothetical protein WBA00_11245 [Rhodococcus sp. (in: high G+C Gram-positive bacteria)]